MPLPRLLLLTLTAFAANSVLYRLALFEERMDPALFTLLRLTNGTLVLLLLCRARHPSPRQGDWGEPWPPACNCGYLCSRRWPVSSGWMSPGHCGCYCHHWAFWGHSPGHSGTPPFRRQTMKIAIRLPGCSLSASLLAAVEDREAQQASLDAPGLQADAYRKSYRQ